MRLTSKRWIFQNDGFLLPIAVNLKIILLYQEVHNLVFGWSGPLTCPFLIVLPCFLHLVLVCDCQAPFHLCNFLVIYIHYNKMFLILKEAAKQEVMQRRHTQREYRGNISEPTRRVMEMIPNLFYHVPLHEKDQGLHR